MAKQIHNKSVSFNLLDPYQALMKKHAEQYPNFSGYIKRLIQRDMEDGNKKAPTRVVNNQSIARLNGIVIK
ncbi:hypothetical protein ABXS71_16720 [Bacillus infantis]|uniref:hypothetical protein n=1 Tax=Bacillus infantis TaxID=324767 RepID=UPI00344EEBEE